MANDKSLKTTWFRTNPEYGNAVVKIDRENRIMYGVSACTAGEAKGHGVSLDDEFIDNVVKLGNVWKTGVKSRFGHPAMSAEALGTAVGKFKNFRRDGDKAIADIHFYKDVKGADEKIEYIMDLAEEDPKSFATSIVFSMGREYKKDKNNKPIYEDESGYDKIVGKTFVEIKKLNAVDFVDEPAANPGGLFSSNTLAEQAYNFLEENQDIYKLLCDKPEKFFEFIKKYSELKGEDNMPTPAELNADLEQNKIDSDIKIDALAESNRLLKEQLEAAKSELDKLKLSTRDNLIASFVAKLPDDPEKKESVKIKLEKLSEKLGTGEEFIEFAELLLSKEDQRIIPKTPEINLPINLNENISIQDFDKLQSKLLFSKGE